MDERDHAAKQAGGALEEERWEDPCTMADLEQRERWGFDDEDDDPMGFKEKTAGSTAEAEELGTPTSSATGKGTGSKGAA